MTVLRGTRAVVGAFLRRDFGVARSYRLPFAMELVSSMFMLLMFYFVAQLVEEGGSSRFESMKGGYFPFVVVGLATFRMLQTTLTTFTTQIRLEQTTGTLAALLSTPTSTSVVILGSAAYSLVRSVISATLMILLAFTLGLRLDVSLASGVAALFTVVAAMLLFAGVGVAIAAFTIVFKQAQGLVGLVTAAVSLLSGVYFPVEVLPDWLGTLSRAIPVTWAVTMLREQLLESSSNVGEVAGMFVAGIVACALALLLFSRAMIRARQAGALNQF